jgi:hypothetical protein
MAKPGKAQKSAARNERLSAALRENLKRRKAQARGRAADSRTGEERPASGGESPQQGPDFRRNPGRE